MYISICNILETPIYMGDPKIYQYESIVTRGCVELTNKSSVKTYNDLFNIVGNERIKLKDENDKIIKEFGEYPDGVLLNIICNNNSIYYGYER